MIILPSLEIVPAKYNTSTNTLLSQIPIDGTGDFTVSRTTSPVTGQSTRVNALGLIELVPDNVPRLDYPIGGGCPALLVEPSAQNLLLRSEEFNDAYWSKTQQGTGLNPVVTPNNAISPDGNQTADLVVFNRGTGNSSNDRSILSSTSTIVSGSQYNGSVWVKAATPSDVGKQIAFRHVAQATHLVITLTANWVRYNQTESSVLTAGDWRLVNIGTVTADNVVGVHVWGAQLEVGSVPTSYIPTTTGQGSRSADAIVETGASGFIGQTEGTIYMEVDIRNMGKEVYLMRIDNNGSTNVVFLRTLATNVVRNTIIAPTTSGNLNISSAAFTAGIVKIAFAYKSGEIALSVNGATALTTDGTFAFNAALSRIHLGSNVGANELNDRIRAAALYPTRLTNTQLALLTSPYTSYSSMASALSYTLG